MPSVSQRRCYLSLFFRLTSLRVCAGAARLLYVFEGRLSYLGYHLQVLSPATKLCSRHQNILVLRGGIAEDAIALTPLPNPASGCVFINFRVGAPMRWQFRKSETKLLIQPAPLLVHRSHALRPLVPTRFSKTHTPGEPPWAPLHRGVQIPRFTKSRDKKCVPGLNISNIVSFKYLVSCGGVLETL